MFLQVCPKGYGRSSHSLVALFIACHTMKEKITPSPTPIQADGQALTALGESDEAAFSPDGQKIVFAVGLASSIATVKFMNWI